MSSEIRNPQSTIRNRNLPIGIFDSGVGGLTVYRALHERLPEEHFVYLGDTARVPYGTKSLSTVERYGIENAKFLEAHGIKLLVVACNTASALALPAIRDALSVPVVGVIEPGARAAVAVAAGKTVGIIATEATVKSGAYASAIARIDPSIKAIEQACPLFVPLAEEGWAETDVARAVAEQYLSDFRRQEIGALVLGCTHYPILRKLIGEVVGANVSLIDSGEAAAHEVQTLLESTELQGSAINLDRGSVASKSSPEVSAIELAKAATGRRTPRSTPRQLCDDLDHFYVTDAAERFAKVAERFLGMSPSVLEAVEVWGHDELRTN